MHLTRSHGLVYLQISNLISYSGWFFILPVTAFAVRNMGGVAEALAGED